MKKILAIVLSLAMLLNLGGISVFAEGTEMTAETGTVTGHTPGGYTSVGYTYSGTTEYGVARIWGDAYVNPKESFVIEIYSGETLLSTTTLNNVGNFLNGEYRELTWNNNIVGNFDEYWTTVWEEGHPVSNFVPDNLIMYVDGVEVDRQEVQMNRADNLDPVVWEDIEGVAKAWDGVTITNLEELKKFRDAVNGGDNYDGKTVTLTADINLENEEWTPIGNSTTQFNGMFDGGNHKISNLNIPGDKTYVYGGANDNYKGFFGYMKGGNDAGIKNLTIENASVTGCLYVGAILGRSYTSGIIENCHVTGDIHIDGYSYIGGLVGRHDYSRGANVNGDTMAIYNCSVIDTTDEKGTVNGDYEVTYAGGIVGFVGEGDYVVDSCSVKNIAVSGTYGLGGISGIGHYGNTISNGSVEEISVVSTNNNPESDRTDNVGLIAGACQGNASSPTVFTGNVMTEATGSVTYTDETTSEITDLYGNNMNGSSAVTNYVAQINGTLYETLQEALDAAQSGDTVTLMADIALAETLVVDKEGTYIIDGNGFTISQAEGYTDKQNALIMLGSSGYGDSAIANHIYTLKNIVFDGITGWSTIRSQGVDLTVTECQFINGNQTQGQSILRVDYTEADINNCIFDNNKSLMAVGFNYNADPSKTDLVIDECVFSNNTVAGSAVVQYAGDNSGSCTVTNSEFTDNTVNSTGNAATLYLGFKENCTVTGCLFSGNAVDTTYDTKRVAGGIMIGYEAEITNNVFADNTATQNGEDVGYADHVCASTYYTAIDLSGNYWGGSEPGEGTAYFMEYGNYPVECSSYYKEYTTDENGNIVLSEQTTIAPAVAKIGDTDYKTLQEALDAAVLAGDTVTVEILEDIDLTGTVWTPVYFNSYRPDGANTLTINGNNKTITGLSDMLFSGIWTGTRFEVNNLTFDKADIRHDVEDTENIGVGAIVGNVSAIETVALNNVKLTNSYVEGGHWTGGFFGYVAGYSGNDGPVFTTVSVTNCEVSDSEIVGKGSTGGIVGHATGDAWTSFGVEETALTGNTVTSTGSDTNKAGVVMGTIGAAGTAQTTNGTTLTGGVEVSVTESGNTVTSNETVITTVYGRQGSTTGALTVTGGTYENNPIEENVSYAAPAEGYVITQNENGTYGLTEEATLNTTIYFLHRNTTQISPIDELPAYRTRVYAGVDSLKYKSVGFEYRLLDTTLPQLDTSTDTVYRKLTATVGTEQISFTPDMFKVSTDGVDLSHIFALNIFVPEAYGNYQLEVRAYAENADGTKIYSEWYSAPYKSNGTAL